MLLNTPAAAIQAVSEQLERLGWAMVRAARMRRAGKIPQALRWERRVGARLEVYKLLLQHERWFERQRFRVDLTDDGYKLKVDNAGYTLAQLQTL